MTRRIALLAISVFPLLAGCGSGATTNSPAQTNSAAPSKPEIIKTKSGDEMVLIPAGTFEMGSRANPAETPHKVTLNSFYIDRTEVTQEQMARIAFGDPSHFRNPKNPAEMVPWTRAVEFCNARSAAEGLTPCYDPKTAECNFEADGYRLPTEAEWEYACRAGTDSDYSFGSDARKLSDYAWFKDNSGKKTHPVAQKQPNAWGLYDMHGNVAEWCNDVFNKDYYKGSPAENPRGPADGDYYVLRGGAWESSAGALRSSARAGDKAGFQDACFKQDAVGFRCARKK